MMCKAGNSERPTVCEVEGCEGTYKVSYHKSTGLYACNACRIRYRRKGTFAYHLGTEKPDVCKKCKRKVKYHYMGRDGICHACLSYYQKHGTYRRKIFRRTHPVNISVCQQCRSRVIPGSHAYYRGGKWLCYRCYNYHRKKGHHRPKYRDTNYCRDCQRPLVRGAGGTHAGHGLCWACATYRKNHGVSRPIEYIQKSAPHGWCECGKPATVPIDLRTGGLLVVPTNAGFSDYLTETRQEYTEWMCDECAGLEAEMQDIDTSDYRPTGYFNSREAGR